MVLVIRIDNVWCIADAVAVRVCTIVIAPVVAVPPINRNSRKGVFPMEVVNLFRVADKVVTVNVVILRTNRWYSRMHCAHVQSILIIRDDIFTNRVFAATKVDAFARVCDNVVSRNRIKSPSDKDSNSV